MCLISKWRFPKKAKKDIVCYKILRSGSDGKFYTPFIGEEVDTSKPLIAKGSSFSIFDPFEKKGGYIHSFKDCHYDFSKTQMWKCIIPKGTRYHEEAFDESEYCSRKLIFLEKL